jgi:hypothetical protein
MHPPFYKIPSVILGLFLYIAFIRVLVRKLQGAYQYSIHRESI